MKKVIKMGLLATTLLVLVGCNQSPNNCQKYGYSGMVLSNRSNDGGTCSMGTLSPSGKHYMTKNGIKSLQHNSYLEFVEHKNTNKKGVK